MNLDITLVIGALLVSLPVVALVLWLIYRTKPKAEERSRALDEVDDLDRALQRQDERRSQHWLASDCDRLGPRGGDHTGYVPRHDQDVTKVRQAGGYE